MLKKTAFFRGRHQKLCLLLTFLTLLSFKDIQAKIGQPPLPPPTITSFSPTSGIIGTSVTITGTNFNATANQNIVFFGATKATVTAASTTSLTVTVPTGATYEPISVLNLGTTLMANSAAPFGVTFTGGAISATSLQAKVDFATGNPRSVSIGDLDGDGKADLVVANRNSATISVYRNTATSGSITSTSFADKVDFTTGDSPTNIGIGDLDGDGKADLVVANNGSHTISIFRNTATSGSITSTSFADKVDFATGLTPLSISIGDLDGNGKADVVVANLSSSTISVFRNTATSGSINSSSFAGKVDFATGTYPRSVIIGDLDGDGKVDLAVVNEVSSTLSVFRNTATSGSITSSSFADKVDFATGTNPRSVSIGDLDGDGKADLAVANYSSTTLSIFRNTATSGSISSSSFAAKEDFTTGTGPQFVSIGDLDGDGKADLVVINISSSTLSVFRNTTTSGSISSSSFAGKVDYTIGSAPFSLSIGDLDGDGKADLAVANFSSSTISIFRNNPSLSTAPPTITPPASLSVCSPSTLILTASGCAGTVTWSQGAATGTSLTLSAVGTYSITATCTVAGTTSVASSAVTGLEIKAQPNAPTITPPTNLAVFTPSTLTLTAGGCAGTVTWSQGAATGTSLTLSTVGTYSITATCTVNGCISEPSTAITGLEITVPSPPTITIFSPTSGIIGTSVTITGTNFNATAEQNIVFFGATKATVTAASTTSLTVTVPVGATYQAISVLNLGTVLMVNSAAPFRVTFTGGAIAATSFDPKVDFSAGSGANSVTMGDLDGDGKPDLVVAFRGDDMSRTPSAGISVYRNTATSGSVSSTSFASKVDFITGRNAYSVCIGDLDGDGKPELLVFDQSSTISVFRNTASSGSITSSSFASKIDFPTGSQPFFVSIGDLDGDGKPDLVVANRSASTISVLRNTSSNASISFESKVDFTTGVNSGLNSISIADLDGDGKPDLVVANDQTNNVSVFRNIASSGSITSGSFESKVDFNGIRPFSINIGDLDGDGKPDLVVANPQSASVSVFHNTATSGSITSSSFASKVDFTTGSNPTYIRIGDLDGDGKPDLVVANNRGGISVIRNIATSGSITSSSFEGKVDYVTDIYPNSVSIGDLDGDGKPDLVVAINGRDSGTISVLRNNPSTAPPTITPPASLSVCSPATLTLTASGCVGTVTWSQGAVTGTSLTLSAVGTYSITATCTVAGTTSAASTAVTGLEIKAQPTASVSSNSPVCSGNTISLSAGGLNTPSVIFSDSYAWSGPNSFSSTLQNPSIVSATTAANGTYQVIVTNVAGCTAIATTSVRVNALPTASASSNSPLCAGNTISLLGGGLNTPSFVVVSDSYAWSGPNSYSSTLQNPSVASATTAATGNYQLIITNVAGCTAIATTSVIVNALPTATASSNSPVCAGTTLNLLGSGLSTPGLVASGSYAWSGPNSFSSTLQNPSVSSATTAATGNYQLIITNANGCTAIATTSVIVNALPTATASSNSPVCAGTTLNLLGGGLNAPSFVVLSDSYAWSGPNSYSSTLQNPSIASATTAATGTYQLIVTNVAGCTAIVTTSVTVNSLPTASASSNSPLCAGNTISLLGGGLSAPVFAPSGSYAWTGPNSFSSALQNPSVASATTAASGTYQLIITNTNGCTAIATTLVTVNALPTASASSNSPLCAGTTVSLSASGGTSYAWTGPNSFSSTLQNPSVASATTAANGSYEVIVTNVAGCTAIATTSVTVNPVVVIPTPQANTQIIFGGSVTLTATGCSSVNDVLKWYQSSNNTLVTMPVSPLATTNYYAKCESTLNGITCISRNSTDVNVTAISPTPPVATVATNCLGTATTLTATGCSGAVGTFVLKWYQNTDDVLVTMPVSPLVSTDYYAKCEQTFNAVTAISNKSNVVTLTILNPPTPIATGGTIYNSQSTTLNATGCSGTLGTFTLRWYQSSDNASVTMPVSPTVTTQYYAKCEQTANAITCLSAKSNDVTVTVVNRIFVDVTKIAAPIQNGNSWATAYGSLQTGLTAATSGIEIWVAKGTYKPTNTLTRTIYFNIPNNVIVYGGFAGTEDHLIDRNFRTNTTFLSGDIGTQNLMDDNSYHVVTFSGSSNSTTLDGFTITGGNASFDPKVNSFPLTNNNATNPPNWFPIQTGGGILIDNAGKPIISNCIINKNTAWFGGGIFCLDSSTPSIQACDISNNQATFGGAIYAHNASNFTMKNVLIAANKGIGGVYNNTSNPTLTNCTVASNGGYNGAIFNVESHPTIKNSILWGNAEPVNDTQSIISYSIVQGGYSGTGNLNVDPQLVNPAPFQPAPNTTGDYHLKATSLAIDRGNNDAISLTDKDLDGNLRRFSGGKVDMGAYEFQGIGTSILVISVVTGPWEANSTWDIGRVPQLGDYVIIDNSHIVTLSTSGIAKNLQYRGTGTLKFNSATSKLELGF